MHSRDLPIVRELPLFTDMSQINFDALVSDACVKCFQAHVDLFDEGNCAEYLYVLLEGQVELYSYTNSRETSIQIIEPVGIFILTAVATDSYYLMSARTYSCSRILIVPASDIRLAFKDDTEFARAIVEEMGLSYRLMVSSLKDVKLRTGIERLSNCLLSYHKAQGEHGIVQLPCDKRTLASLLGMTAETLSRSFNKLMSYNVEVSGSQIHLNDINALTILAKPNPFIEE